MNRCNLRYLFLLVVAIPSVIIGTIAMKFHGVSHMILKQNIAFWLISCLLSFFAVSVKKQNSSRTSPGVFIFITIMVFFASYFDEGIGGVHRWVSIGPVRLYISSILLPILIIQLWKLISSKKEIPAIAIAIIVSVLLFLQPDASQLTAFVISMVIIILSKYNSSILKYIVTIILITLVILSWIFLDKLPAVSYVEDIVLLVSDMGLLWYILGIASLVILPLPFILLTIDEYRLLSRCVGIYFIIVLISTWFGNFPVPLMGYGVSPVIGYYASITWLIKQKLNP